MCGKGEDHEVKTRTRTSRAPKSAADPRPEGHPYYIGSDCPKCDAPLVLADIARNPRVRKDRIWHDEWECPRCRDGIYMDWPAGKLEALAKVE